MRSFVGYPLRGYGMNPFYWSFRAQFLSGMALCAGLLGFAFYSQRNLLLDPCPLCIMQRVAFMVLGLVFLLGALHAPKAPVGRRVYAVLAALVALTGATVAGRHLWLQALPPDQVPACGPGLSYLLEAFPLSDVVRQVFTGSGECAKVDWTFLGLAMPGWTFIWYVAFCGGALWAGFRRRQAV